MLMCIIEYDIIQTCWHVPREIKQWRCFRTAERPVCIFDETDLSAYLSTMLYTKREKKENESVDCNGNFFALKKYNL